MSDSPPVDLQEAFDSNDATQPFSHTVVGGGRLAQSLVPTLLGAGLVVNQVLVRDPAKGAWLARHGLSPMPLSTPAKGQWVWLCISDHALQEVAQLLTVAPEAVLIHVSGASPLSLLPASRKGVVYPLQSFPAGQFVDWRDIPLFVEGSDDAITEALMNLAKLLSQSVQQMDSPSRLRLHLGAVFASNFVNHLLQRAAELVPELPFSVYGPLIRNQIAQALKVGPAAAQTGPALRADYNTLAAHLQLLAQDSALAEMYANISQSINPSLRSFWETQPGA